MNEPTSNCPLLMALTLSFTPPSTLAPPPPPLPTPLPPPPLHSSSSGHILSLTRLRLPPPLLRPPQEPPLPGPPPPPAASPCWRLPVNFLTSPMHTPTHRLPRPFTCRQLVSCVAVFTSMLALIPRPAPSLPSSPLSGPEAHYLQDPKVAARSGVVIHCYAYADIVMIASLPYRTRKVDSYSDLSCSITSPVNVC